MLRGAFASWCLVLLIVLYSCHKLQIDLCLTRILEIYPGLLFSRGLEQGKSSAQVSCCIKLYNPRLCKYMGCWSCFPDFWGNKHYVRIDTWYQFIQWSNMCLWKAKTGKKLSTSHTPLLLCAYKHKCASLAFSTPWIFFRSRPLNKVKRPRNVPWAFRAKDGGKDESVLVCFWLMCFYTKLSHCGRT